MQPKNYKEFNEKGHEAIAENAMHDTSELLQEQFSDENRQSSDDLSEIVFNQEASSRTPTKQRAKYKQP